jgi:hypothetical protein
VVYFSAHNYIRIIWEKGACVTAGRTDIASVHPPCESQYHSTPPPPLLAKCLKWTFLNTEPAASPYPGEWTSNRRWVLLQPLSPSAARQNQAGPRGIGSLSYPHYNVWTTKRSALTPIICFFFLLYLLCSFISVALEMKRNKRACIYRLRMRQSESNHWADFCEILWSEKYFKITKNYWKQIN